VRCFSYLRRRRREPAELRRLSPIFGFARDPAHKYAVASYTPHLQFNNDGSLSVYMAQQLPAGVPMANWLPIPPGAFNIMLRVYGPEGTVKDPPNTYVPPPIERR
jgi:hypothetical protein